MKGELMNKEQVLAEVKSFDTDCSRAMESFMAEYMDCMTCLHDMRVRMEASYQDVDFMRKIIAAEKWVDKYGLPTFINAIKNAPDEAYDKICGFVIAQKFILNNSKDSAEKLMDQMFYIPGYFATIAT